MPSEPTAGRQKRCAIVGAPPKRINLLDVPGEFDRNCYTVETRGGRNGFPAAGESCPRSFQPRPAACTRSGGDGYAEVAGRALQEVFIDLAVSGLASMYPALDWS